MQKTEIYQKITKAIDASDYDALLIAGYENVHYLSGIEIPFAAYRPDQPIFFIAAKNSAPVFVCPCEWAGSALETGSVVNVMPYRACDPDFSQGLIHVKNALKSAKNIGIDLERVNCAVFAALESILPEAAFVPCDEWLDNLRMIKTETEIKLLKRAAYLTDHGINGALHHVTVDRRTTALTLAEEFRVHTIERGMDITGYHSCANVHAGSETPFFWANPAKFGYSMTHDLHPAEMARLKVLASKEGYWTDASRTMVLGDMNEDQEKYYGMLVALRDVAINKIKPGVSAAEIFHAMSDYAKIKGMPALDSLDLGHGIGAAPSEPPYINPCDHTILRKGMVLVIAPVIQAHNGELWISKDTIVITESSCEIIGWYKDWREPYIPIASI